MSNSAIPIPTLPITSTAGAQSVQIASLTSQIEELVKKNTALTQQYESRRSEWEIKLAEENNRGLEAAQRIREASKVEVQTWKDRCETIRVAGKHSMEAIAYAQKVAQADAVMLETKVQQLYTQLQQKDLAILRSRAVELRLANQMAASERSYLYRITQLEARCETAEAALAAVESQVSLDEDRKTSKLQVLLQKTKDELQNAHEALSNANADVDSLTSSRDHLGSELEEEKRKKKVMDKEVKELREQIANWKRLDGRDADSVKEGKTRIRELESSLANEQRRVEDLEKSQRRVELENKRLQRDLDKLSDAQKERDNLRQELQETNRELLEAKKSSKERRRLEMLNDKENIATSSADEARTKKRPRAEFNDADDPNLATNRVTKKAKVEPTKERAKSKDKESSKSQSAAAASKVILLSRSPSPVNSGGRNEKESTTSTAPKSKARKFKSAQKESQGADSESEDLDTKRQKFFGKTSSKPPTVDPNEDSDVRSRQVDSKASGTKTGDKKKAASTTSKPAVVTSKTSSKLPKSKGLDEEAEEVFDLSAVSSAEESEDDAPKTDAKSNATSRKNAEPSQSKKVQASKSKPVDRPKGADAGESKPKKRTMNLLGGMTTNGISSTDWWAKKDVANVYNIPSMLSSPEKGPSADGPRAKFDFGKGW